MARVNIEGKEYPIGKVFSNDFVFSIPHYQRPYSWTTEHSGELLDDLITFMGEGSDPVDDLNPYFLGSIVLIKEDPPDSEVVDGQQRLTTLAILLSVMRTFVSSDFADALAKRLYEKGDPLLETPDRPRVRIRKRDDDFFQDHIHSDKGIQKLHEVRDRKLPDAQKNICKNALNFEKKLSVMSQHQIERLAQFITKRCFLIIVSTPDLDSAYRIFSVLNDRGMDLSHADILKAEIIGKIQEEDRADYTDEWEEIEELLGLDDFQDLFAHIRTIYRKSKPRESLLEGFRKYVNPTADPRRFIEDTLLPSADAYHDIVNEMYQTSRDAEELNFYFHWLNRIDNFDWIPPAILFYSKYSTNHDELIRFFTDLERLAAGMMIYRANINKRYERYGKLLNAIEKEMDLYSDDSSLQLDLNEQNQIWNSLDGDIYHVRNVPRFVLLRLDSALSEGTAAYNYRVVSVEHVLPQNPRADSEWMTLFPDQEFREGLTHRLGNLVLLSRRKNSQARNYDFEKKKEKYFVTRDGISPFALTTQVIQESKWTPKVVTRRQEELLDVLSDTWRLQNTS